MNDIRRTILWVIFGFSMVLLWDQWQLHNGKQATFFPSSGKPAAVAAAPVAARPGTPASGVAVPSAVVPAGPATPGAAAALASAAAPPREKIVVRTDVLRLTFDTEGGSLVRTEFVKYNDTADKNRNVSLLEETKDRVYVAQSGLIGDAAGAVFPNHKTPMAVSGARDLKDGENELVISFTSPEVGGTKLVKTYTLRRGSYNMAVRHAVENVGAAPVAPQLYLQLVRDGNKPEGESSFYSTFTGPAVYTDA